MRDTYRLPYKHAKAAQKVKDKIDEGAMDYSDLEKLIYAIGFVGAGVLSFFSVEFYLRIGGQGTKYLPFGKFSESFGAKAAFGSNLTFNFYCIMDTLFSARNEYYQYKIATAKDIGLITSKKTTIAKYGIASLGALAAGIMMAVIAGSSDGVGVQAVTLIVNVFLNFLGMRELTNVPSNIKSTYQKFRKKMSWDSEEEQSLLSNNVSADWYLSKLDNSTSIPPLITPNNIFTKKEVVTLAGIILLHLTMQYCDKISLFGFWQDTMNGLTAKFNDNFTQTCDNPASKSFFSNNPGGNAAIGGGVLGTLLNLPFVSLTTYVVYETTDKKIIGLTRSAYQNIKEFYKNPDWSTKTKINLTAITITGVLTLGGYFFGYVSSNSGLGLNACYGWNDWWNVTPTAFGTMVFNGFGFMNILMEAYNFLMPYLLQTATERTESKRTEQMISFFNNYSINDLAETQEEMTLRNPTTSQQICAV